MDSIQKKLDDLGDGLKRSKKEITFFMRKLLRNKFLIGLMVIVVIIVIVFVALRIFLPSDLFRNFGFNPPPNHSVNTTNN